MSTPNTTTALADISQYLWTAQILQDNAFNNGVLNLNRGRDVVLYVQNEILKYGIENNLSGLQGVSNNVYRLCGAKLQEAKEILATGSSGGIVINSSTLVGSLKGINAQFRVGSPDTDPLFNAGESIFQIDIGVGSIFDDSVDTTTFRLSLDQADLPRNTSPTIETDYISYRMSYSITTGLITVTMNQPAQDTQLYIPSGSYLVVN